MEFKDFRIGNVIKYRGGVCEIDGVMTHKLLIDDFFYSHAINFNDVEPIEIDRNILLKIGFSKEGFENDNQATLNIRLDKHVVGQIKYNSYWCKGGLCFSFGNWVEEPTPIKDLKYVHQIQNLYHSLTGEDLEFDIEELRELVEEDFVE